MFYEVRVRTLDLILAMSSGIDLISSRLKDHHRKVAYIALRIAREAGLSPEMQQEVYIAGLIHDCGALDRNPALADFDFEEQSGITHAEVGYRLLAEFAPLRETAIIVRHHHDDWAKTKGDDIPLASHIIHLADRVSVLVDYDECMLAQGSAILRQVREHEGGKFMPELVRVFSRLAEKEIFWGFLKDLDTFYDRANIGGEVYMELSGPQLLAFANILRKIIDFRCHFTATHSAGVGATASFLAEKAGFSETECTIMKVGGFLHDIGKLSLPQELIYKKEDLTAQERRLLRTHVFHTARILGKINGLGPLHDWAAYHHERIDGTGYPFRIDGRRLPLGSRIMAVADVFSAMAEERPYRAGMGEAEVLDFLSARARDGMLDSRQVESLAANSEEAFSLLKSVSEAANQEYESLKTA